MDKTLHVTDLTQENFVGGSKVLPTQIFSPEATPLFKTRNDWQVGINMNIQSILKIDTGKEQTFQIIFRIRLTWYQEEFKNLEKQQKFKEVEGCGVELPLLQILNAIELEQVSATLRCIKGGLMIYGILYRCTIKENFELQNFPFDSQYLNVRVRCISSPQNISFREQWPGDYDPNDKIQDEQIQGYFLQNEFTRAIYDNSHQQTEFIVQILYKRSRRFYLLHVYTPLCIVQLITFSIPLIDPVGNFADTINIILISLLTMVAFRFTLSEVLPQVSYLTIADYYFLINFITCLTLTITEVIFCLIELELIGRIIVVGCIVGIWLLCNILYFIYAFTRGMILKLGDQQFDEFKSRENSYQIKNRVKKFGRKQE